MLLRADCQKDCAVVPICTILRRETPKVQRSFLERVQESNVVQPVLSASFITDCLTHIFNLSICIGIIPEVWKRAHFVPLYKEGYTASLS